MGGESKDSRANEHGTCVRAKQMVGDEHPRFFVQMASKTVITYALYTTLVSYTFKVDDLHIYIRIRESVNTYICTKYHTRNNGIIQFPYSSCILPILKA